MRALERWLPGWLGATPPDARPAACVYMSGSGLAVAKGVHHDGRFDVDLRADPIQQLSQAREILKRQSDDVELNNSDCNLVLAPELYSVSLVEKPQVAEEDLKDAVRWQVQEHVDFPVEQATLDVFPLPESAARGRPMVFVVAMQKEFLKVLLSKVHEAGIHVSTVDISELALRNIVHGLFPEADQGVALLRLTGASGVINISRGEELFLSRRVSVLPREFDAQVWDGFREKLLLQVQRSIDYYESAMSQPPCNGALVAATHGWQEPVCEYLSEMLPVPIRPIRDELRTLFDIRLHNPSPELIDWDHLTAVQSNALSAALPALGGLLRRLKDRGDPTLEVAA